MSNVWRPKADPPKLDRYCHLSHDAQRVLLALHSDYLQHREELIESRRRKSDPRNYYQSIYAARFGPANPSTPTYHKSSLQNFPRKSTNSIDCNISRRLDFSHQDAKLCYQKDKTCSPDSSRYSDSPPVETQDFRILTQLHREEMLLESDRNSDTANLDLPSHENTGTENKKPGGENEYIDDSFIQIERLIAETSFEEINSEIESESTIGNVDNHSDNRNLLEVIGNTKKELGSQSLFSQDAQTYQEVMKVRRGRERKQHAEKHCVVLQKSYISDKLRCSHNIHRDKKLCTPDVSKMVEKATHSRPANNNSSEPDDAEGNAHKQHGTSNAEHENMVFKPVLSNIVASPMNRQSEMVSETNIYIGTTPCNARESEREQNQHHTKLVTFQMEEENPLPDIALPSTTQVVEQQKLFPIFIKADRQKMNTSDAQNSAKSCKRASSTQSFDVPFKKYRGRACEPNDTLTEISSTVYSTLIYIEHLGRLELIHVISECLQSEAVVLSLVYTDSSTQLRESLFGQEKKKRATSKQLQSSSTVIGAAVGMRANNFNTVFIFPESVDDPELLATYRCFWEKLLSSPVKKFGFEMKTFLVELVNMYRLDSSTVCAGCRLQDLAVAMWLLDPDKPVTTFEQAMTCLGLPQQTPCDWSTKALPGDMLLLSTAMDKVNQELGRQELLDLFLEVECRLTPLLAVMELQMFHVATHTLLSFSELLKKKLQRLEQQAHQAAGHPFLLNSHAQLRQVLFETLRLDTKLPEKAKLAKTMVGKETSTSEAVLHQLSPHHPLPGIVLEYRQLQKLKSTYIDGVLGCVYEGKLQTHWDQTAAATGRITSYQPNIQAIPKAPVTITNYNTCFIAGRSGGEKAVIYARDCFISRPGYSLLAADFQQIELRLLCHLAKDPGLIKIFNNPDVPDIFNALTAEWLGKSLDGVTTSEREQTKRVVYSVMYGAGKDKLAEYLKISPENAKAIIKSFLIKFPAVNKFTKASVDFCRKHGYTRTIFKRRRLFPNIKHASLALRAQAERQCVNFCVQGSAADLCKAAMLQVEQALAQRPQLQAKLLVQIHDELLYEVADSDLQDVTDLVTSLMESCASLCQPMAVLSVPIAVSVSVGKTWGQMQPVTADRHNCL